MNILKLFLFFILSLGLLSNSAEAKKPLPKEIRPIIHENIKYVVDHSKSHTHEGGWVKALDAKTGKLLWEKQIYKDKSSLNSKIIVLSNGGTYITSTYLRGDFLIIINEKEEIYSIDLKTKVVEKIEKDNIRYSSLKKKWWEFWK